MKKLFSVVFSAFVVSVAQAQIRVVNYNVHFCSADMVAMDSVLDAASKDDTHGKAMPVSIFMFQEVTKGKQKILHGLLGETYSKGTYTNSGESGGAQAMFYHAEQLIEKQEDHADIYTGATRNADRWHLLGIGENKGIDLWVYSAHLKASPGRENKEQRVFGVKAILEDITTLSEGANVIVVGDMNFYTVREPAYQAFIEVLIDPLGTDEWAGIDDAKKHTQSTRKERGGGLASGGLDDRFDFQFISSSLLDGEGLDLTRGSYHSLGNDGKHFDVAITEGESSYFSNDTARSAQLATVLYEASDHLPVIADYDVAQQEKLKPSLNTSE